MHDSKEGRELYRRSKQPIVVVCYEIAGDGVPVMTEAITVDSPSGL